jgi:hypothetical protein
MSIIPHYLDWAVGILKSRLAHLGVVMKINFLTLVLIVLVGLVTFMMLNVPSRTIQQGTDVPPKDRLKWYAREAKKEGRQKAVIQTEITDYMGTEVHDIEQVLSDYTVVVAQPVMKRTYQSDDNNLITWYKFSIVDALTPLKNPVCFGCLSLSAPGDIPLDYHTEFLVPRNGGTFMVDGVEIEQREAGFAAFQDDQKYLLFISLYPNRVALTAGGPLGVFMISEKENLTSFSNRPGKIQEGLKTKFQDSLISLKKQLKSH